MDIDELLAPLSEESPGGEDLEYDPEFGELERTAAGTPEKVLGDLVTPAVPPDWKQVRDQALSVAERTRDFRVGICLANAWLNLEGFGGFRNGLQLILGMCETLWDSVHPQLDEDDGDPTMRANAIRELVNQTSTLAGVLDAPFVQGRVAGSYGLRDLKIIKGELIMPEGDERPKPKMDLIEAAFRESSAEDLEATQADVAECRTLVGSIGTAFENQVGAVDAPDLSSLEGMLAEITDFLSKQLSRLGIGEVEEEEGGDTDPGTSTSVGGGASISGDIRSSDDVLRMIDKLCLYYHQQEPSSPVPILLKRAASLVNKNFLEIVADLAPSGVTEAQSFGPHEDDQHGDTDSSVEASSDEDDSWE